MYLQQTPPIVRGSGRQRVHLVGGGRRLLALVVASAIAARALWHIVCNVDRFAQRAKTLRGAVLQKPRRLALDRDVAAKVAQLQRSGALGNACTQSVRSAH